MEQEKINREEQKKQEELKYLKVIDSIIKLIIEATEERKLPTDYVSRLYQVQMDVMTRVIKIMKQQRREEQDAKEEIKPAPGYGGT